MNGQRPNVLLAESRAGCESPAPDRLASRGSNSLPWIVGWVDTPVGEVPRVSTSVTWADRLGAAKVRLNIRRMGHAIDPGLYAVGRPTSDSPVLASANYKLSFDHLRRELDGLDAWVLVLDTGGINVWCAAGKGTFGTDELVGRIAAVDLREIVSHRVVIVPQLGAPGVAAHKVKKQSGFRVVYGPVRARDIPAFVEAGLRADAEMRRVRFGLWDRLVLAPVELVLSVKYAVFVTACFFLLAGLNRGGYDSSWAMTHGSRAALLLLLGWLAGAVLTPALLPWLPGRAFATKGAVMGLLLGGCVVGLGWIPVDGWGGRVEAASWLLLLPAITSFLGMNFTGASTYTSLSGVRREMRFAVPAQVAAGAVGLGLWLTARFLY